MSCDVTGAGVHDQLMSLAQHDHEAPRAHQRAPALDDQLEHVLERDLPADRDGHVARGLEAASRLLELSGGGARSSHTVRALSIATAAHSARITAASSSRSLNCPPCFSVRYRLPHACPRTRIGTPRKLVHHRMSRREPVAAGVPADVGQAQRGGMLDQHAEHAASARQIADRSACLHVDARGQELLELGALARSRFPVPRIAPR